jgi:hypothetical protein
LRTRFSSYPDLERAVALSVREDGRLFVPLLPEQVRRGETLKVAFTTDDGAAAVNRLAVVESTTPDRAISGGARGVVLRLHAWKPALPPAPADEGPASFEEPRNPLAGIDTNMVSLLVECTLTESNQEVGHSYDDIPCVELPAAEEPDDAEPTRRAPVKSPPLVIEWANGQREIVEVPEPYEEPLPPAGWRPRAHHLLVGSGLGLVAAAVMALAPAWTRGFPLPAVMKGLSGSIATLDGHEPLPPVLLAIGAAPPLIPPAPAEVAAEPSVEEPAPAAAPACLVRLSSRPSRADIWWDGRRIGRTPSEHLSVPCGAELVVKRARYQPASAHAPVEPGGLAPVSVSLVRPSAHLQVTSVPDGAEVRLHGRTVGLTPATLNVSRYESITVEVRAPHQRSWRKHLYVRDAEVAVRADLAPRSSRQHRGGRSPRARDPGPPASSPQAPGR